MKKMKSSHGFSGAITKKDNFQLKISKNLPYGIIIGAYTLFNVIESDNFSYF